MTEAVRFVRYSPRPDEDSSESNRVQVAQLDKWCAERGYEVRPDLLFAEKAVSRDSAKRPALWDAVVASRNRVLVVASLDRIGDAIAVETVIRELKSIGGQLATVDGGLEAMTPERTMMRTILGAVALYEKQKIAAVTRARMLARQAAGESMGGHPPAGKRRVQVGTKTVKNPMTGKFEVRPVCRLEDNPEEQELVKAILEHGALGRGDCAIATIMREGGKTFRGNEIGRKLVARVLARNVGSLPPNCPAEAAQTA